MSEDLNFFPKVGSSNFPDELKDLQSTFYYNLPDYVRAPHFYELFCRVSHPPNKIDSANV
jgi:hypothetical protein